MSLFSNDMRVANTATPSFDHQTNVGQFGWTGADSANYNQLIQYVDECRKIWLNLEEKILYVEQILETVTNIDDQIKYVEIMTNEVMKWRQEVLTSRDLVSSMYNKLVPLFEDFNPKYEDGVKKYTEVVKLHGEVEVSTAAAAASEAAAAKSAQEAADVAEELRKGQVYRGTWNIQANNGYPPKPDTNSVWDITLNEGVIEFRFDGTIWYWGDRLLYLKDDDKFTQIEAGGSVTSVNGKKGAVTLTATDVGARPEDWFPTATEVGARPDDWVPTADQTGALPITGGTLTGQTIVNNDAGLQVRAGEYGIRMINSGSTLYHQTGKMDRDVNDQKLALTGWYGTPLSFFRVAMAEGKYAYIQQGGTDYRIYHQGYKPTFTDVGGAPAGFGLGEEQAFTIADMDTDPLTWNGGKMGWIRATSSTLNKPEDQAGVGTIQRYQSGSNSIVHITLYGHNNRTYSRRWSGSVWANWKTHYDTSTKPSAADVGAVPLTDITSSGEFGKIPKMSSSGVLEVGRYIDFHYESAKGDNDGRLELIKNSDGTTYSLNVTNANLGVSGNLYEKGQRVYSEGYRPTAAGVGAVASEGNGRINGNLELSGALTLHGTGNVQGMVGGFLRCNTPDVMSLDGKRYSFVTSPDDSHLCQNSYWDGVSWQKYDVGRKSMHAVCVDGDFRLRSSNATSVNPMELTPFIVGFDGHAVILRTLRIADVPSSDSALFSAGTVVGSAGSLVRGSVGPGGWESWSDRASGVQVDVVDSRSSATNIWKATHWGQYHMGAMDIHSPVEGTVIRIVAGGNTSFSFYQNGQGLAPAGWHTGSDAKFKENIKPLSSKKVSWLDKVCSLEASSFKYKTNVNHSIGFIAQGVQEVIPEAVTEVSDTTLPESERAGTNRLYLDPMAIIAAQNEAIKELTERLVALEAKLN